MHFRCVDSSVNNVLLQTSTSRFLSAINSLLHGTANTVEWTVIKAVKGYVSGMIKFTAVFLFLSHVAFVLFPQVMQQQTLGELEICTTV